MKITLKKELGRNIILIIIRIEIIILSVIENPTKISPTRFSI